MLELIAVRPLREVIISDVAESELYDQIEIDGDMRLVKFYRCDCSNSDSIISDCEHDLLSFEEE